MSNAHEAAVEVKNATEVEKTKFAVKSANAETGDYEFHFGNGHTIKGNIKDFSHEIQRELLMHGLLQKVGDSYSGAKGDFAKAIESAQGVVDQLREGKWTAGRVAAERGPKIGELVEAVARLQKKPVAEVAAILEKADDGKRKALRSHPAVKAAIAAIRAEKAAAAAEKAGAVTL